MSEILRFLIIDFGYTIVDVSLIKRIVILNMEYDNKRKST